MVRQSFICIYSPFPFQLYQVSSSIINVMFLNHHEAFLSAPPLPSLPPCCLWKNCLLGNQLLLPKIGNHCPRLSEHCMSLITVTGSGMGREDSMKNKTAAESSKKETHTESRSMWLACCSCLATMKEKGPAQW